jgi:cytochrome c5
VAEAEVTATAEAEVAATAEAEVAATAEAEVAATAEGSRGVVVVTETTVVSAGGGGVRGSPQATGRAAARPRSERHQERSIPGGYTVPGARPGAAGRSKWPIVEGQR